MVAHDLVQMHTTLARLGQTQGVALIGNLYKMECARLLPSRWRCTIQEGLLFAACTLLICKLASVMIEFSGIKVCTHGIIAEHSWQSIGRAHERLLPTEWTIDKGRPATEATSSGALSSCVM